MTTWADLYKGLIGSEVSTAEGYYDAVSSATKIAPNVHYRHIPAVVNKVETIENGKAVEAILDGVKLTGKEAKVTYKVTKKDKKAKNKITVSKAGKVTVKKGLKKGKYKVTVKITAAGKGNYKAGSKVVTLVVKVK